MCMCVGVCGVVVVWRAQLYLIVDLKLKFFSGNSIKILSLKFFGFFFSFFLNYLLT